MSTPILPPDPCLLAIILITKTRDGTNNVFHYPPQPGLDRAHNRPRRLSTTSSTTSDASKSGDEDDDPNNLAGSARLDTRDGLEGSHLNIDESGSTSPEKSSVEMWARQSGGQTKQRSGILGLPDGFHHFLCPPDTFNKKRFEMTIGQLVFLGWPVYAKVDGSWGGGRGRRKKRRSSATRTSKSAEVEEVAAVGMARRKSVQLDELIAMNSEGDSAVETGPEDVSGFEAGYGHDEIEEADQADEGPKKEVLSMFNMAFVLSPSPLEYQHRTDEMYKHVVKKFTKALRWEQVKSDFMLKESERLRGLRAKHGKLLHVRERYLY